MRNVVLAPADRPTGIDIAHTRATKTDMGAQGIGWAAELAALSFMTGLGASMHCSLMCGPLLLARAGSDLRFGVQALFGRVVAYAMLGAAFAQVGVLLPQRMMWLVGAAVLVLALLTLFLKKRPLGPALVQLSPTSKRSPARVSSALVFGASAIFLPCGVLYAGLLAASAAGTAALGALSMGAFALASSLGIVFVYAGLQPALQRYPRLVSSAALLVATLTWSRSLWILAHGAACHA